MNNDLILERTSEDDQVIFTMEEKILMKKFAKGEISTAEFRELSLENLRKKRCNDN